ncbi:MAG: hypothetical protein PUP93_03090 [Rhizonema sp. NSF051]|nr:hypothetical protein [Rhizonema sp. NSF051]
MLFQDIRDFQILFLSIFLILGISTRDWTLRPELIGVAIATCLSTQWFLSSVMSPKSQRKAEGRRQKAEGKTISGGLNPPLIEDHQIFDLVGAQNRFVAALTENRVFLCIKYYLLLLPSALCLLPCPKGWSQMTQDKQHKINLRGALITSLGLSLLLRADQWTTMAVAASSAITSKFVFKVGDKHFFNPANFGIISAVVLTLDAWVSPGQWGEDWWYGLLFAGTGGMILQSATHVRNSPKISCFKKPLTANFSKDVMFSNIHTQVN